MLKAHLHKIRASRRLPRNKWAKAAFAFAIVLAVWMLFFMGGGDNKSAVTKVHVGVAPATRRDVPITVDLVGTVVAYETVSIKSRLDSQIMEVHFKDGDFVKEGDPLFDLDDRSIKAELGQLEAALQKEKAGLANTELQYKRAQGLIKSHVIAQAQFDDAKAAYQGQVAQTNAAQANLDNTRVQLTYTKILAPISGRTGTIAVTRGNNVKANDTVSLVTINRISPIRVQFAIPQRYYDQVRTALAQNGVPVKARNKDAMETQEGKLQYLDNAIDAGSGTFAARAIFANQDEKLWPGMFVNISLDLGVDKGALTIPAVAVQGDEGKRFVFIVGPENKAVRKAVDVASITADTAIVTKGLAENDQVVYDGLLRVSDGTVLDTAPFKTDVKKDQP